MKHPFLLIITSLFIIINGAAICYYGVSGKNIHSITWGTIILVVGLGLFYQKQWSLPALSVIVINTIGAAVHELVKISVIYVKFEQDIFPASKFFDQSIKSIIWGLSLIYVIYFFKSKKITRHK